MQSNSYYIVNGITFYRLIVAPVLLLFIFTEQREIFKWLLAFSFFTDAIDGYLARKYKVVSVMGSKLDSLADDLTILVAIVGLFFWHWSFIVAEYLWISLLFILYLVQLVFALIRYKKTTSFHTYLAKIAAIFQAVFLVLTFFLSSPPTLFFYAAAAITALDIIEETIMVYLLPKWQADVKGLHEVLQQRR
ncbi:CDP-alcohol phosphatidyltransferase family protein [Olivibacter sp. SDN3]|uniref:CDP-alcohol phosphatidyltransferase family protein n=1 Tax=Olivibacter sp. SDN3 TaxID=2764720 RepID=UPI0016511FB1|nr:CDP-alcohol phosphatidyltransferase family protein [Olivibacter sp. SDN3]QNL48016.1 CDP-alcohol phosphatidyltransferase family protein [Olivibacter sp. SDN3]